MAQNAKKIQNVDHVQDVNKAQNVWKTTARPAERMHGQRVRLTVVGISIVIYVGLSIWNRMEVHHGE